jgi:hypothetical protein
MKIGGDSVPDVEISLTKKMKSGLSFAYRKTKDHLIVGSSVIIVAAVLGGYYFLKYRPENNIVLLCKRERELNSQLKKILCHLRSLRLAGYRPKGLIKAVGQNILHIKRYICNINLIVNYGKKKNMLNPNRWQDYCQDLETADKNLEEAARNCKSLAADVKVEANRYSNQFFYNLMASIDLTNKIAEDFIECYVLMLKREIMLTEREKEQIERNGEKIEYKQGLFGECIRLPYVVMQPEHQQNNQPNLPRSLVGITKGR